MTWRVKWICRACDVEHSVDEVDIHAALHTQAILFGVYGARQVTILPLPPVGWLDEPTIAELEKQVSFTQGSFSLGDLIKRYGNG